MPLTVADFPAVPARAYGEPLFRAKMRTAPADFFVDEELPFAPDGEGEHVLVRVEKRGHNTAYVAGRLAHAAGIRLRDVGFSGRKDRHAVTRQWFSLHLPGSQDLPDLGPALEQGIRLLALHRHGRKLHSGTHRRNRFVIVLRDVEPLPGMQAPAVAARLGRIACAGVPNYFGEQRFGRDGSNLVAALAAVADGRLPEDPARRGMLISTLRAAIFNAVLDARVRDGSWERLLPGERVMLDGTGDRSFAHDDDPALAGRLASLDVHPGGPLAGTGGIRPLGAALELETGVSGRYDVALAALARWRVESGRRPLRSRVMDLVHDWPAPDVLRLSFALWRGSFATAVIRELCEARDASGDDDPGE